MGMISADMKRIVEEQRLGFVATVCPDGTPNLSPKGTTRVWDADHLVFANIRSPATLANLRQNANVEVNVVDPFVRKGYRFKGSAVIHAPGTDGFVEGLGRLRQQGSKLVDRVKAIVVIEVQQAQPLVSPAYDDGSTSEMDMVKTYEARFARLLERYRDA